MKGKLILQPIPNPVEGMQGVWKGKKIGIITEKTVNEDMVEFEGEAVDNDDLSQIAVEYEECCSQLGDQDCEGASGICKMTEETLPLHPSDWEWAIKHIGEEVEFVNQSVYVGQHGNGFHTLGNHNLAYLTPDRKESKTYTEEEVDRLMRRYLMDYRHINWFEWWGENKKK